MYSNFRMWLYQNEIITYKKITVSLHLSYWCKMFWNVEIYICANYCYFSVYILCCVLIKVHVCDLVTWLRLKQKHNFELWSNGWFFKWFWLVPSHVFVLTTMVSFSNVEYNINVLWFMQFFILNLVKMNMNALTLFHCSFNNQKQYDYFHICIVQKLEIQHCIEYKIRKRS